MAALERIRGGLVVSAQAGHDSPLHDPAALTAVALDAQLGGADGFRLDGSAHISAIKAASHLPIIGIRKNHVPGFEPYITATFEAVDEVVKAGADIVAIDATQRRRPVPLPQIIGYVRETLGLPVMADCSTVEETVRAHELGADLVSTTLAGYTPYSARSLGPDFKCLVDTIQAGVPRVVVEGRIWSQEDVACAFDLGAFAVVVGTAVTSPRGIVERLRAKTPSGAVSAKGSAARIGDSF